MPGRPRETSLRSRALALRRVAPLLVIKIIGRFQHSEIALTTAGFNMNASVLAKWHPGEVQRTGRMRHRADRQHSHRDVLALLISEARAQTHRFCPSSIKERGPLRKLVTIAQRRSQGENGRRFWREVSPIFTQDATMISWYPKDCIRAR